MPYRSLFAHPHITSIQEGKIFNKRALSHPKYNNYLINISYHNHSSNQTIQHVLHQLVAEIILRLDHKKGIDLFLVGHPFEIGAELLDLPVVVDSLAEEAGGIAFQLIFLHVVPLPLFLGDYLFGLVIDEIRKSGDGFAVVHHKGFE